MSDERSIDLEIEVPGTPEEVWTAIATGPGISSWYVPHTIEEREGGAAVASFGPGPEMQVQGRIAAWDPPHRVVITGDERGETLAFEWLVEARDGGSCVVRLVNSGFGTGEEWDDQYDGMVEGWQLFLRNLRLHLEHFAGRTATPMLPMAMWGTDRAATWAALTDALGISPTPSIGDRIDVAGSGAPPFAGTVAHATPWHVGVVLDEPAPGTAFIAAEGSGDQVSVSIWSYLYGDDREAVAARDEPRWRAWFEEHAPAPN